MQDQEKENGDKRKNAECRNECLFKLPFEYRIQEPGEQPAGYGPGNYEKNEVGIHILLMCKNFLWIRNIHHLMLFGLQCHKCFEMFNARIMPGIAYIYWISIIDKNKR